MTKSQRKTLMSKWWPDACRAQGWKPGDRVKRLDVISVALGRVITSANDLDNVEDINKVKRHLGKLASNLAHTVEEVAPEIERARRLRYVIRGHVATLARHLGREGADKYLAAVIADKFSQGAPGAYARPLAIDDLSAIRPPGVKTNPRTGQTYPRPSQLDQLLMVLARAVQARRDDVIENKENADHNADASEMVPSEAECPF